MEPTFRCGMVGAAIGMKIFTESDYIAGKITQTGQGFWFGSQQDPLSTLDYPFDQLLSTAAARKLESSEVFVYLDSQTVSSGSNEQEIGMPHCYRQIMSSNNIWRTTIELNASTASL